MSLGAYKIVDQPDVIILTLGDTILSLCVAICQSETLCILTFYICFKESGGGELKESCPVGACLLCGIVFLSICFDFLSRLQ